ncbi:MAG: RluA family pseudouridine synthase [Patescibacteria group bacterium]|nr:RluA family pseudouridine synthase [Patescibacteria group bacterium]MCL5095459.1 RluA family pseudouridine synthase [Patescibacteria group bacterium]
MNLSPKILYEDEEILVIDKPSGMIVNKADTTKDLETVQDWVEKKFKIHNLKSTIGDSDFVKRAGIVHRTDKETSGLLLIAKTEEAFLNLQAQFKERKVKKTYLTLVHGQVAPEEGEIKAPIGRLPWQRERFGVFPGGREAETRYKVLSIKYKVTNGDREPLTFLEVWPLTGRTHQIRVHLKYLGFPIVGDEFYAGRKRGRDDRKFCPRVFLHAASIEFLHPATGKLCKMEAKLPEDLQQILSSLI